MTPDEAAANLGTSASCPACGSDDPKVMLGDIAAGCIPQDHDAFHCAVEPQIGTKERGMSEQPLSEDERVMESLLQAKLALQHAIDTINSDGKKRSRLRRLEEPGSGKSYEAATHALDLDASPACPRCARLLELVEQLMGRRTDDA